MFYYGYSAGVGKLEKSAQGHPVERNQGRTDVGDQMQRKPQRVPGLNGQFGVHVIKQVVFSVCELSADGNVN